MHEPSIQAALLVAVAFLAWAFLADRWGDRRTSKAVAVLAACALLTALLSMAVFDIAGDPLRVCLESGGVQMVHVDGGWQCVPADQMS